MHCREAYADAEGLLAHSASVGALIGEFLASVATLSRVEIHGPASELEELKEPFAAMSPEYFVLEYEFRK